MYDNKSFSQITDMLKDGIINPSEARLLLGVDNRIEKAIKAKIEPTKYFDIVLETTPLEAQPLFVELEDEKGFAVAPDDTYIRDFIDEDGLRRIRISLV